MLQSEISDVIDDGSVGINDDLDDDDDDDDDDINSDELFGEGSNVHPKKRASFVGNSILRQEEVRLLAIEGRVDELDEEEQLELATRNSVRHQRGREKVQGG